MTADDVTASATGGSVEMAFREVYGHAVATLTRVFGDISLAEDAVQDAFAIAATRWERDDIPANPAGWVVTTARNRAIDQLRRDTRGQELIRTGINGLGTDDVHIGAVDDDRLRVMFTCCHPALRVEHQVALTLRLLGGPSVGEIGHAFLVGEAAMAKRLVRAKFKIRAANIPYRVPEQIDLPLRVRSVLAVLYLIYTTGADEPVERAGLRAEAIRLSRLLTTLMPAEPEAAGLLGLMLLNDSCMPARRTGDRLVLLRVQDRSRWDQALIAEGHDLVRACIRRAQPGPFQLQAAIQAVHCHAPSFETTEWPQIVALYDHLYDLAPSPVIALSRAIARAETGRIESALAEIDGLGTGLEMYAPFHAARATLLRKLDRDHDACDAFRRAASLATSSADRDHFLRQIAATGDCHVARFVL